MISAREVASAVSAYADRMHRAIGSEHHVASPLGAWLLLALIAPAADGDERAELERVLGLPAGEASGAARDLLAEGHPAVASAVAAWTSAPGFARWAESLGEDVERGPVPTQAEANEWARKNTLGLIDTFPLEVAGAILVLASALACDISWRSAFTLEPRAEIVLPSAFERANFLRSPSGAHVDAWIVHTDVGLVAAHSARSATGELAVVSVIADPGVPSADVLRVAHAIAPTMARREPVAGAVELTDLPLGRGHSWELSERSSQRSYECVLPAWSAQSETNLLRGDFGFAAAVRVLRTIDAFDWVEAVQVARADYTRVGFRAAAVTAISVGLGFSSLLGRFARIEFTHPHAVVAVALADDHSCWQGIPVFSAWVAEVVEGDPAAGA